MPDGFSIACPTNCFLSRRAPVFYRLLVQSSFRAMPSQKLRLNLNDFWEFFFQGAGNSPMELLPRAAQQRPIGSILYQDMLEKIRRMGRDALPKQQTGRYQTFEFSL